MHEPEPPLNISEVGRDAQIRKAIEYVRSHKAARKAAGLVDDLKTINFKEEVIPLNHHTFALLKKNFVFWAASVLAVTPLLLVTLKNDEHQITGMCLFFAAIWGVVFKRFIVEETEGWAYPIVSLFFTGLIGTTLLIKILKVLPAWYSELPNSENAFAALLGNVLQTGLWEETIKAVPVIAYVFWKKKTFRPLTAILIGVFSGLGFAAFENVAYADLQVVRSARLTDYLGLTGLNLGVKGAMVNVVLRSISNVFAHALYTGIFSYFITVAFLTKRRRAALVTVGLLLAATLHGFYNWFWQVQSTLPAVTTLLACMLFFVYLTKLRLLIAEMSIPLPVVELGNSNSPADSIQPTAAPSGTPSSP